MSSWLNKAYSKPKIKNSILSNSIVNTLISNNNKVNDNNIVTTKINGEVIVNNKLITNNSIDIKQISDINLEATECYKPELFSPDTLVYYCNQILSDSINNFDTIVNVYKPFYKNNKAANGLGDFIRGSIFLYQLSILLNKKFKINIKYHNLSIFFENIDEDIDSSVLDRIIFSDVGNYYPRDSTRYNINTYIDLFKKIKFEFNCSPIKNNNLYICMNSFPLLYYNSLEYIKSYFTTNILIVDMFENILKSLGLNKKSYNIIHIRSGDEFLLRKKNIKSLIPYREFFKKIKSILEEKLNYTNKNILICDSSLIKEYILLQFPQLIARRCKEIHFGEGEAYNSEAYIDTLIDYNMIINSNMVISISTYYHGSGFVKWPCILHNIPILEFFCGN